MEEDGYNNKYDALASTIKIEDISPDEGEQDILRRLKDNDPTFDKLWICDRYQIVDEFDFCPTSGEELVWLGYFLGKNTTLKHLYICSTPPSSCNAGVEDLCKGLGRNRSIRKLSFTRQIFHMLDLFFKHNDNLSAIEVTECDLGVELCVRLLTLAFGDRNSKSLKHIKIAETEIEDGQLSDIIVALSMHPQVEELDFSGMNLGRNECTALSTLLRNTTKQLQTLKLQRNNIDDEGIEALTNAISGSK